MARDKTQPDGGRPAKRTKLLDDEDESSAGEDAGFKINEEYARRFEHNKKREERQRLEEKYGKDKDGGDDDDDEESSSSEDEDDDAMLATEALDAEISATLNAIRSRDPRVYDASAKFYSDWNPDNLPATENKEKPMTIRDYHRQNLMDGKMLGDEDEDQPIVPYAREQAALKKELASVAKAEESDDDDDDDFLIAKDKPKRDEDAAAPAAAALPTRLKKQKVQLDLENAEKDPENFLSNFLASRAWTLDTDKFAPLESDDDDDDRRADEFEMAYNMRFEDPATANEKLQTFARDAVAKTSVRRDEKSTRQKQRDKERERKDAIKRERDEGKARLRKLKIEEMEEKLNMIKEAAGMSGKEFNLDEWRDVLDADWDDDRWDQEMQRRFGDDYYADKEAGASESEDEDAEEKKKKKKKPKKPTWDDDIDIKDIIPDFEGEEEEAPPVALSGPEDEEDGGVQLPDADGDESDEATTSKKKKKSKKDEIDAKRAARRERRIIESMVDQNIDVELAAKESESGPARFRYRETSPTTFGLTARDILLADDAQLNEFAGLKKMASWRDPEKKKKDKKKLGKKARLRQWRKDTFGDEEGPKYGFGDYVSKKYNEKGLPIHAPADVRMKNAGDDGVDIREGKKKKRGKKRKVANVEA